MRSSIAARLRALSSSILALLLASSMVAPIAWADQIEPQHQPDTAASVEADSTDEADSSGEAADSLPIEEANAVVPVASVAAATTRTYVLPAATLSNFSVANIVSGTVELAPEPAADEAQGESEQVESDIPTISTTYVAEGCVYVLDEEAGEFTLVNAANAELTEEGYLFVPSALLLDDEAHPVTSVAAGALSGTDAVLVALSKNIVNVDEDALADVEYLQAVYVSPYNDTYSSYDGCLYTADSTSLLLVPEGKLGTVRIAPSAQTVHPEVFSHCAYLDAVFVDADSAAFQALEDVTLYNAEQQPIEVVAVEEGTEPSDEAMLEEGTSTEVFIESTAAEEDANVDDPAYGRIINEEVPILIGVNEMIGSARIPIAYDIASEAIDGLMIDIGKTSDPSEESQQIANQNSAIDDYELESLENATAVYRPDLLEQSSASDVAGESVSMESRAVALSESTTAATEDEGFNRKTYTRANIKISTSENGGYMLEAYSSSTLNAFSGTIEWTGNTDSNGYPAAGATVTVQISEYIPTGSQTYAEDRLNFTAINYWGGDEDRKIQGFRDANTGDYTSVDDIYSGNPFTISFVKPAMGCTINSSGIIWADTATTFKPEFEKVENMVISYFTATAKGGYWLNERTGRTSDIDVATYSKKGDPINTPSLTPMKENASFTKWTTDEAGTSLMPAVTPNYAKGVRPRYVAQFGTKSGSHDYDGAGIKIGTSKDAGSDTNMLCAESSEELDAFKGSIEWTGPSTSDGAYPAAGATVTVHVDEYIPTGRMTYGIDRFVYTSVVYWGGDRNHKILGFRDSRTGFFLSVSDIYSGKPFAFSFVMPSSDCTINNSGIKWYGVLTTIVPEFEQVSNQSLLTFSVTDYGGYWLNTDTGMTSDINVMTYSTIGQPINAPSCKPAKDGGVFTRWVKMGTTELMPSVTPDGINIFYSAVFGTEAGHHAYKNANLIIEAGTSATKYMTMLEAVSSAARNAFTGSIEWTGPSTSDGKYPAPGATVTVNVDTLLQTGNTTYCRERMDYNAIGYWGGSASLKLVGFRDSKTASYVGVDKFYSGESFSISFVMPSSGCTINQSGITWRGATTTFVPQLQGVSGMVVSTFNIGTNGGYWLNASTNVTSTVDVVTYSKIGEPLVVPSVVPIKDYYTFAGWFKEAAGTNAMPTVAPSTNGLYFGKFTIKSEDYFFLQFDGNGVAGTMADRPVPLGTSLTSPHATFVKRGYSVVAWNTKADGTGTSYPVGTSAIPSPATSQIIKLYAMWERDTYQITYALSGGTNAPSNPSTYNVESATITLGDPSRTGYAFMGWTGGGYATPTFAPQIPIDSTGDVAFTANWQANSYTIRLNAGEKGTFPNASEMGLTVKTDDSGVYVEVPALYDEDVALPLAKRTGHALLYWTGSDGSPAESAEGGTLGNGGAARNLASAQGATVVLDAAWDAVLNVAVPVRADIALTADFTIDAVTAQALSAGSADGTFENRSEGDVEIVEIEDVSDGAGAKAVFPGGKHAGAYLVMSPKGGTDKVVLGLGAGATVGEGDGEWGWTPVIPSAASASGFMQGEAADAVPGELRVVYAIDASALSPQDMAMQESATEIARLMYTVRFLHDQ